MWLQVTISVHFKCVKGVYYFSLEVNTKSGNSSHKSSSSPFIGIKPWWCVMLAIKTCWQCTKMSLLHAPTQQHMKTNNILDSRWRGFGSIIESTANSCLMMSLIRLDIFTSWHGPKSCCRIRGSYMDKG